MFTSRAEHRLFLRPDNCYERLFPVAQQHGLLTRDQKEAYMMFFDALDTISRWVKTFTIKDVNKKIRGEKYFRRPEASLFDFVPQSFSKLPFFFEAAFNIETNIKYEGYIENERLRMEAVEQLESLIIPKAFDFAALQGLSNESKGRLIKVRPETLGQASRISGLRPTDITLIGLSLKRFHVKHNAT